MNDKNIDTIIKVIKDTINESIEEIIINKLNNMKNEDKKTEHNNIEIVTNDLHLSMKRYINEMIDIVFKDLKT